MNTTVHVMVDIDLLRQQRDWLLTQYQDEKEQDQHETDNENLDGLVNMLDHMLDVAEGYKK